MDPDPQPCLSVMHCFAVFERKHSAHLTIVCPVLFTSLYICITGQSGGNVITPTTQPLPQPTRRSSRLFGSTQSVKENSKALGKGARISVKSPTRKSKPRVLQRSSAHTAEQQQLSEMEKNEKNKGLLTIREKVTCCCCCFCTIFKECCCLSVQYNDFL